jgi:hypothetical protein
MQCSGSRQAMCALFKINRFARINSAKYTGNLEMMAAKSGIYIAHNLKNRAKYPTILTFAKKDRLESIRRNRATEEIPTRIG